MRYFLPTLLVFCSQMAFAQFLQRSPLPAPRVIDLITNRGILQRVDRENGIYYYDSLPVTYDSSLGGSGGEIILQPFISVAGHTGEAQFHLWVTYYPPLSPAGDTVFIRPKYLSILTARNKVTLPLMFYYPAADIPAGSVVSTLAPGKPSPLGETAYAILSSEDLSGIARIALEGINDTAVEAWEPTATQRFKEMIGSRKINSNVQSQKRSIGDYLEFQRSIGSTNTNYRNLNWGEFDPVLPEMANQRAVSLVLYGENATQGIETVQERLVPVLEMVDLYQALSNRQIAMP